MKYEVTVYFSEILEIEAENENEAISKANEQLKNINTVPIADSFDVQCLEEEQLERSRNEEKYHNNHPGNHIDIGSADMELQRDV